MSPAVAPIALPSRATMTTRQGEVEDYLLHAAAAAAADGGRRWRPSATESDLARCEDTWTVLLTMPPYAAEMVASLVVSSRRKGAIGGAYPRAHSLASQRPPFQPLLGRRRLRLHVANRQNGWPVSRCELTRAFASHPGHSGSIRCCLLHPLTPR